MVINAVTASVVSLWTVLVMYALRREAQRVARFKQICIKAVRFDQYDENDGKIQSRSKTVYVTFIGFKLIKLQAINMLFDMIVMYDEMVQPTTTTSVYFDRASLHHSSKLWKEAIK